MEKEVEVQEINGVEYFIVATRSDAKGNIYDAMAQMDNPSNIIFVKEIVKDGEDYFRIVDSESEEYIDVSSLFADVEEM